MSTQNAHVSEGAPRETRFALFARLPVTKKIAVAFLLTLAVLLVLLVLSYIFSLFSPAARMAYRGNGYETSVTNSAPGYLMQKGMPASDAYYPQHGGRAEADIMPSPYPMPPEESGGSGDIEKVFSETRQIIRTGFLAMVVEDTSASADKIRSIAKEKGGFVEHVQIYETGEAQKHGSLTVRVPESAFDETLAALKALAREVTSEQTGAQDVTAQAVDLEARLANERRSEAQYQKILEKAETTDEILKVQRELNRVRGTIEQLDAQLQNLSREVRMATISVELSSIAEGKIGALTWKPLNEAKAGVRNLALGLMAFANALIALVFWLPILAIWLLILSGIGYGGYRFGMYIKKTFFPRI